MQILSVSANSLLFIPLVLSATNISFSIKTRQVLSVLLFICFFFPLYRRWSNCSFENCYLHFKVVWLASSPFWWSNTQQNYFIMLFSTGWVVQWLEHASLKLVGWVRYPVGRLQNFYLLKARIAQDLSSPMLGADGRVQGTVHARFCHWFDISAAFTNESRRVVHGK